MRQTKTSEEAYSAPWTAGHDVTDTLEYHTETNPPLSEI